MPKCNWRYIVGAFVLATAVSGSGVWVYYLDNPITEHASPYKNDSPTEKVPLRLERIASALEAIENGQNSQENEDRARRDLDAQEGVWRWAKWAVWVAGVQAILSFVGIAFVILTIRQGQAGLIAARRALRHARVANDIAREIGHAEIKAYVALTDVSCEISGQRVRINYTLKNFGSTPAKAVMLRFRTAVVVGNEIRYAEPDSRPDVGSEVDHSFGFILAAGETKPTTHVLREDIYTAIPSIDSPLLSLNFITILSYRDVFDKLTEEKQDMIALIGAGINPTPMARVPFHIFSMSQWGNKGP